MAQPTELSWDGKPFLFYAPNTDQVADVVDSGNRSTN